MISDNISTIAKNPANSETIFAFSSPLPLELSAQLWMCYQCRKCTAGCPVGDQCCTPVDQVMGWLRLSQLEQALASDILWSCIGCHTCSARCPNQVNPDELLDKLRVIALDRKIKANSRVIDFHKAFLAPIKSKGKADEVGFMMRFSLKHFLKPQDMLGGLKMFLKGRLRPFGSKIKNPASIKKLFSLKSPLKRKLWKR